MTLQYNDFQILTPSAMEQLADAYHANLDKKTKNEETIPQELILCWQNLYSMYQNLLKKLFKREQILLINHIIYDFEQLFNEYSIKQNNQNLCSINFCINHSLHKICEQEINAIKLTIFNTKLFDFHLSHIEQIIKTF